MTMINHESYHEYLILHSGSTIFLFQDIINRIVIMKRILFTSTTMILTSILLSSCSIAPSKKITRQELARSREAALYIIEDDISGALKVLNEKGEVVVNSTRFDVPVYLQIFATPKGIKVRQFDKSDYDFID